MEACPRQLLALKALLNTFASSTGLKVNYAKSIMVPINITAERLQHLASTFQCQAGSLPFTYLGLPLCISQPTAQGYWPLVQRIEVRLTNTSIWLTQGGNLEMVNFVLSSMPNFYMCAIKVPIEILNQVDKYRRHCLWKGGDTNSKNPPLVAWSMVTKPKNRGGLGVINLRMQIESLLIKNLHKFFNKVDLRWVKLIWSQYCSNRKVPDIVTKGGFWWRSIVKLLNKYRELHKLSWDLQILSFSSLICGIEESWI
jgi:hypothetical protein